MSGRMEKISKLVWLGAKYRMAKMGFLSSRSPETKFVILGYPRTGSNLLMTTLNKHPNVFCYGEIFNNREVRDWDIPYVFRSPFELKKKDENPVEYARKKIFGEYPVDVKAVGFKLFYHHARKEREEEVWEFLKNDKRIKIIHIVRKDLLRAFVSHALAKETGKFVNKSGGKSGVRKITLDLNECENYFEKTTKNIREFDRFFSEHSVLKIFYENLSGDFDKTISEIEEFLGLEKMKLSAGTKKQGAYSLSEVVTNYS